MPGPQRVLRGRKRVMTLGGWLHQARAARAEERYAAALGGVDRPLGTKVTGRAVDANFSARILLVLPCGAAQAQALVSCGW